jgi:acetyl-CoA acetyltransferase
MRDAVIVEAVRTPVGKRNGGLSGVHPVDLSAHVLRSLVERSGVDPGLVDDVIWGCVGQVGEQTFDLARNAVLAAGWPESVPGGRSDRGPVRPGRRRWGRVDVPGADGREPADRRQSVHRQRLALSIR